MYPSLYESNDLPIRLVGVSGDIPGTYRQCRILARECIADVILKTDEPDYPVKRDGIVIWPVGTFQTTLCGPELAHAFDRRRIIAVDRFAHYQFGRPLRDFARTLYAIREHADSVRDDARSAFAKCLLNSIVGKMGQKEKRWVSRPDRQSDKPYGYWYEQTADGGMRRWRAISWNVQCEVLGQWANDAVPAVATWITSLGRLKLLSLMQAAGTSEVYYIDTDALIVSSLGYKRLVESGLVRQSELGYLRLITSSDHCEIFGIKHYRLGGVTKRAGLPKNVERVDSGNFGYQIRSTTASDAISGHAPRPRIAYIDFADRQGYKHGAVSTDGIVYPHKLSERAGNAIAS
jgi:hypothetical protein